MRSNIEKGQACSVASPEAAEARLSQLRHEVGKIEKDLEDPERQKRFPSTKRYAEWRNKAKGALRHLREEMRAIETRAEGQEDDYEAFWRQP